MHGTTVKTNKLVFSLYAFPSYDDNIYTEVTKSKVIILVL